VQYCVVEDGVGRLPLGLLGLDPGLLLVVHGVEELDGVAALTGVEEDDGADEDGTGEEEEGHGTDEEVVVGVTALTGVEEDHGTDDEVTGVLDGALDEERDGQSVQR
jgi:hypothetical protein